MNTPRNADQFVMTLRNLSSIHGCLGRMKLNGVDRTWGKGFGKERGGGLGFGREGCPLLFAPSSLPSLMRQSIIASRFMCAETLMASSTKAVAYNDWRRVVDERLRAIYCITIVDAGFDEEYLDRHWKSNETPAEFVEWFGNKYDLYRRPSPIRTIGR